MLQRLYGGGLGFDGPRLYANFVSTIDGIVAIPSLAQSNKVISAASEADRFVMGLLRVLADVVLIGAGTLGGSPNGSWTSERAFPPAAHAFADLRRRLGLPETPELAILSGGGSIAWAHPALDAGAVVLTSESAATRLRRRLPARSTIVTLGSPADDRSAPRRSRAPRARRPPDPAEGGPRGFGSLVAAGVVDEPFLTVAPLLGGRAGRADRLGLAESVDLLPLQIESRLLSVRRDRAHLFLRYRLERHSGNP